MRPYIRLTIAGSALATVAIAGPAMAATSSYGMPNGDGAVSSTQVQNGQSVTFSGSGFRPGSSVAIKVDGVVVDTVIANSEGAFSTRVKLSGCGNHTLTGSGLDANGAARSVSAVVNTTCSGGAVGSSNGNSTAVGASTSNSGGVGGLPFTGLEVGAIAGLGAALLIGGATVRIVGRRHSSEA